MLEKIHNIPLLGAFTRMLVRRTRICACMAESDEGLLHCPRHGSFRSGGSRWLHGKIHAKDLRLGGPHGAPWDGTQVVIVSWLAWEREAPIAPNFRRWMGEKRIQEGPHRGDGTGGSGILNRAYWTRRANGALQEDGSEDEPEETAGVSS